MKKCSYFLLAKRRTCHFDVVEGSEFCHHHNSDLGRVPCPANPNHSVAADKVEQHLLICPDARRDPRRLSCYKEGINLAPESAPLCVSPPVEQSVLVETVRRVHAALRARHGGPQVISDPGSEIVDSAHSQKHTPQHRGLALLVQNSGAINPDYSYVEMCAGKAGLARFLRENHVSDPKTRVVAIDRQNFRRTKDSVSNVERIRIDVADLDFARLAGIGDSPEAMCVVVGKHACGGATDLTLRCVTAPEVRSKVACVVLALCCHQLCTHSQYLGLTLLDDFGITASDFPALCRLSSWALDGNSGDEKRRIGLMVKEILNIGRVEYMNRLGFKSRLVQYCDEKFSKENIALVCLKGPCVLNENKRERSPDD